MEENGGELPVSVSQAPDLAQIYEAYHRKVAAYAAKLLGRDRAEEGARSPSGPGIWIG